MLELTATPERDVLAGKFRLGLAIPLDLLASLFRGKDTLFGYCQDWIRLLASAKATGVWRRLGEELI